MIWNIVQPGPKLDNRMGSHTHHYHNHHPTKELLDQFCSVGLINANALNREKTKDNFLLPSSVPVSEFKSHDPCEAAPNPPSHQNGQVYSMLEIDHK